MFPPTNTTVEMHEYFGKWKSFEKVHLMVLVVMSLWSYWQKVRAMYSIYYSFILYRCTDDP
jgi:hypothetical protein